MGADTLVPSDRSSGNGGRPAPLSPRGNLSPSSLFPSALGITTLTTLKRAVGKQASLLLGMDKGRNFAKAEKQLRALGWSPWSAHCSQCGRRRHCSFSDTLSSPGELGSGQACRGPWLRGGRSGGEPDLDCLPRGRHPIVLATVTLPAACPVAVGSMAKSGGHPQLSKDGP